MFSIVLYNLRENRTCLYRDHSGQKHLYYTYSNNILYYASELESLLCIAKIPRDCDVNSILIASKIGYIPGNKTVVESVYKLLPGEQLSYDINKCTLNSNKTSRDKLIKNSFSDCIKIHFQSARLMALNLSGGLDSSVLLHEAYNQGIDITTYTSYYDDGNSLDNSEAFLAKKLSQDYHTDHREIPVNKNIYLKCFIESYSVLDEPNYNVSIPLYHHMAKTQGIHGDGFRVLFSGDGGDEVFYGYKYYDKSNKIDLISKILGFYLLNNINTKVHKFFIFMGPVVVF